MVVPLLSEVNICENLLLMLHYGQNRAKPCQAYVMAVK